VIGRYCPWELAYYTLRGRHERARVRFRRDVVPVGMNGHTIWSRYYSPREFAHTCAPALQLRRYQALSLFLPPPYLQHIVRRYPWLMALLGRLDDTIGGAPLLRDAGDHFLMTLERVG
jgi:hypothetical protein